MVEKVIAEELLKKSVGRDNVSFRPGQWEAIDELVNNRGRILMVQRTGWGKSLVYFVSTKFFRDMGAGPTIIISPLLALMRNQIEMAQNLGLQPATINSSNKYEWEQILESISEGNIDALLISPERLANQQFVEEVLQPISDTIGLLVIDEAHCISDWGHDFRPDYQRITEIVKRLPPKMPLLATTATANDRVIEDVRKQLGDVYISRGALDRESLVLQTLRLSDRASRLAWLAEYIPQMEGTGVVYVLTRRDAEQVKEWLRLNGIKAMPYYSGIKSEDFADTNEYRAQLENLLQSNQIKVLVATVALGMGYDKPDLAFVIHYQSPGSVISYYQQVGRAGRALSIAYGILLTGDEDENIHEYFRRSAFPTEDQVEMIFQVLEQHDGLTVASIESMVNMRHRKIEEVLKFLDVQNPSPVTKVGTKWYRTAVRFNMDHEKIRRISSKREEEWREIQEYVSTEGCLMKFLRSSLNDPNAIECGRCAGCTETPAFPAKAARDLVIAAKKFLKNDIIVFKPKKQIPIGALTKYDFGYKIPKELQAEQGKILSRWNDAGWGEIVADDKHNGYFRDDLVSVFEELIRSRWPETAGLEWITCVPSDTHPSLVADFAKRVAAALGLPFYPIVTKVRRNEPQKMQENKYHQCKNLDGAFEITDEVPTGSVLLIDDIIDSGWTMTILAALLRQHGSGPVFPAALTSTSFEV